MDFQYHIDSRRGRENQVGLHLKCVSELQANEIYRVLRQHFQAFSLKTSFNSRFTHFTFVNATEQKLRETMPAIKALYEQTSAARVAVDSAQTEARAVQTFQLWKTQFRQAIQQLNTDDYSTTKKSASAFTTTYFDPQIAAGRTLEIEEVLLQEATSQDSNSLRKLIGFYHRTEQHGKIAELCEQRRTEVLALPVSGLLVEQLVSAHLQYSQQTNSPDLLYSAQQLAQEFLPELERLRQDKEVRQLLHQVLAPQEPQPTEIGATLKEKLAQLVEIEPAERLPELESLRQKHPKAVGAIFALAESHRTLGETEQALEIYRSAPVTTEAEREEAQQRCAEILLERDRPSEVIDLLPDSEELSPVLAGLRGAALYRLGKASQALPFLEKAWQEKERQAAILLPLARLWAEHKNLEQAPSAYQKNLEQAASAYQVLLETAPDALTVEDYIYIADIADNYGFGDISDEQIVSYYEACLDFGWSQLRRVPTAKLDEVLKRRFFLRLQLHDNPSQLINAYADWFEWLAPENQVEELEKAIAQLRAQVEAHKISCKHQFELLEIVEPFVNSIPQLRPILINDYQCIALALVNKALRYERTDEFLFKDLVRALLFLDSNAAHFVYEYRQQYYERAKSVEVLPSLEDDTKTETLNLSSLNFALVGGHEATRREVIRELREKYGIEKAVEVAPSSEAYLNRSNVQAQISNCNLIAMITGYMGHDLSKIVSELKKDNALIGEVLPLPCRGKSGVVREIINWWKKSNRLIK
jgi:tetratricopeptide (TPR) repeat protein